MANFSSVRAPTSALSDGGGTAWSNITNIFTSDGVFAISDIARNDVSQWARGFGYGFNLESDSTVLGIELKLTVKSVDGNVDDVQIYLQDTARNTKGSNYARGASIPTASTIITYGGPTDLWGATWSYLDINNANFGGMTEFDNAGSGGGSRRMEMDFMQIVVYYSRPDVTPMMLSMGAF